MLRLYDTRTRQVEAIAPRGGRLLRIYSCGHTVDRRPHIGDLRSWLLPDLIRRNAERRHNLTVMTCQNIGNAADDAFRADCSALNLLPADSSPRASEWIGVMTEMTARLIESGHAHATPGGSVYFDARSFPSYGELSGSREPPADWVLWQAAPDGGEQSWPAPWGTGFPSWDAECSALSLHNLGEVIDIHTGGIGLLFPHHENERAQSDSVTGHEVVRQWVHGEHLLFDGAAMAGAAGNAVLLPDLAGRGLDPLALRLAFLSHRYRQQMDLTWDTLGTADGELRRWRELVAEWAGSPSRPMCADVTSQVQAAFDDDLDTPAALSALRGLEADPGIPPGSKFESFAHADQLLGLDLARDIGRAPSRPPAAVGSPAPRNG